MAKSYLPPLADEQDGDSENYVFRIQFALQVFGALGLISILLYSIYASIQLLESQTGWNRFAYFAAQLTGLAGALSAIAFASFCAGGLLGFLFGIPKVISRDLPAADLQNDDADEEVEYAWYRSNTNLEEMSDWLTKIIIGAGLVQIKVLNDQFQLLIKSLASNFGNAPFATAVVGSDVLGFLIVGFFAGYLLTRLYLAAAFAALESALLAARRRARRAKSLVELRLDDLSDRERDLLQDIVNSEKRGEPYRLPESFQRHTDQHQAIRSLRDRYLIKVKEGGSVRPGKTLELTPIAKEIKPVIEKEIKSDPAARRRGSS